MQAEHIPVHLGAMPAAVAAVLRARARARALVDPQRPVRGRYPPARHHRHHAGVRDRRGRCAARLRRQPRPPRRRRRPSVPGSMPADSRTLAEEGVVIAPQRARRRGDRRDRRAGCASRPSAAPTCARSSPRTASARGACAELAARLGAASAAPRDRRGARLRRAAHPRAACASCPTASATRQRRARGARGRPRAAPARPRRRRRARARLRRQRAAARRATSTARWR